MARLLLGVSGGIAAYKAIELARLAIKAGHAVRVIQTEASTRFVGTASFAGITGAPVLVTEWEPDALRGAFPGDPAPEHAPLSHLELVERADAFLIAPASANTIAKLAGGHADNLLTAAALACRRPLIVAPAMNGAMYEHAATQENLARLRERGARVLEPGTGSLASLGEYGTGRLPEPPELLAAFEQALRSGHELDGLRVLVTAGGTREPIDSVRYVGNRSSGRMGFALAEEAARRGADVTVVAANVSLPRASADRVRGRADRRGARRRLRGALRATPTCCSWRPPSPTTGPSSRTRASSRRTPPARNSRCVSCVLPTCSPTLSDRRRPGQYLVGFAAEHGEGALEYGREKLARKDLDAVVVNDVGAPGIGFDSAENEVTIVTPAGEVHVPKTSKAEVATAILDAVLSRRSSSDMKVPR